MIAILMAALFSIGVATLVISLAQMLRGFVVYKLWGWFMVAVLHCTPIGVAAGIGISLLASFVTAENLNLAQETDPKARMINNLTALFTPFVVLLIGYVAHLYL